MLRFDEDFLSKAGGNHFGISGEIGSAAYSIVVTAGEENAEQRNNVNLEDVVIDDFYTTLTKYIFNTDGGVYKDSDLTQYITYANIAVQLRKADGTLLTLYANGTSYTANDRSVTIIDDDNTDARCRFELNGVLRPDEQLIITYNADIDAEMYEHEPFGAGEVEESITTKESAYTGNYTNSTSGGVRGKSSNRFRLPISAAGYLRMILELMDKKLLPTSMVIQTEVQQR